MTAQEERAIEIINNAKDENQLRETLREIFNKVATPEFDTGCVPISLAAKVMEKDAQYIRAGMEQGWLPIGYVSRQEGNKRANFYISPKLFYEATGFLYKNEKNK